MTDRTTYTNQPSADSTAATKPKRGWKNRLYRFWLPSLLFGDGLSVAILAITMVMLRRMGFDNTDTSQTLALLCLPVAMQPLFEMIVAHFWGTTKVWILSAELISAIALSAVAFSLTTTAWLYGVVCFMPFITCSAVFHNIAANRFYIDKPQSVAHRIKNSMTKAIALLFGAGIMVMVGGNMEVLTRNTRYSWSVVLYVMAGIELFLWLWHGVFLPGGSRGYTSVKSTLGLHRGEFRVAAGRILRNTTSRLTLSFVVLFLLQEAFLAFVAPLYIIDKKSNGGLGLSPQEFALAQGTIVVIAIVVGYIAGCKAIWRYGLHRLTIPATVLLAVHGAAMVYISVSNLTFAPTCLALAIGNAAFGFGIGIVKDAIHRFSLTGNDSTLRHSLAVSFVAILFVVVGLFGGWLETEIGYFHYFVLATSTGIASFVVAVVLYAKKVYRSID